MSTNRKDEILEEEEELQSLVSKNYYGCGVRNCDGRIDDRGTVDMVAPDGTITTYKVCSAHFEGIFIPLGEQVISAMEDESDDDGGIWSYQDEDGNQYFVLGNFVAKHHSHDDEE